MYSAQGPRHSYSTIPDRSKQMIVNHLCTNRHTNNNPFFQQTQKLLVESSVNARIRLAQNLPPITAASSTIQTSPPGVQIIPTFKSNSLMVGSKHIVYCSHIEDGPNLFSIQLESNEDKLDRMMADINNVPVENLQDKPVLGMACLARLTEDNNLYRAVIKGIKATTCSVAYVDYGNNGDVDFRHIYHIPSEYLQNKIFAMRFTLSGYKQHGSTEAVNQYFRTSVLNQKLELKVMPLAGPPFVQYCELYVNGVNMLDKLNDIANECPKYVQPPNLHENDFVLIRYVQTPKKFFVQKATDVDGYEKMMDKLMVYCQTAQLLRNVKVGAACAASYGQDRDWYRVEINSIKGSRAFVKFIDFGISIETEIKNLKTISPEFLSMPKQAIECCLEGFEDIQNLRELSRDQLELLAEDSAGLRRNFKVKINQQRSDRTYILNLIDDTITPILNLSTRMYQLAMPQKSFRFFDQQKYPKTSVHTTESVSLSTTDNILNSTAINDEPDGSARAAPINRQYQRSDSNKSVSFDDSAPQNRNTSTNWSDAANQQEQRQQRSNSKETSPKHRPYRNAESKYAPGAACKSSSQEWTEPTSNSSSSGVVLNDNDSSTEANWDGNNEQQPQHQHQQKTNYRNNANNWDARRENDTKRNYQSNGGGGSANPFNKR